MSYLYKTDMATIMLHVKMSVTSVYMCIYISHMEKGRRNEIFLLFFKVLIIKNKVQVSFSSNRN